METLQKHHKNSKGQTLLEAIVALTVLLMILAGISVAVTNSVSNSTFVKNQNLASRYAQDGMEIIRNLKFNNYSDFNVKVGNYCLGDNGTFLKVGSDIGQCIVNINSSFIREIEFKESDASCPNGKRVTVFVRWSSGKCNLSGTTAQRYCHKSQLATCFTSNSVNATTPTIAP